MNFDLLTEFADAATVEIAKYVVPVTLSPEKILTKSYSVSNLKWKSVKYGNAGLARVPNDKRGIYAFAVCHISKVLPPHGYILYIGIAGRDSDRTLRDRYKDYLNPKSVIKRARIARMIGTWHEVLRFFFAPVDDSFSSDELKQLEKQLNTALMPVFSEGDLEADIKRKRRAFR